MYQGRRRDQVCPIPLAGNMRGQLVRAPRLCSQLSPQNLWICDLLWQKRLGRHDRVNSLDMGRLFWIVRVGSMSSQASLKMGGKRFGVRHREEDGTVEAEVRVTWQGPPEGRQSHWPGLNFWSPEVCEDKFVLFSGTKFVILCYSSNRKQISQSLDSPMWLSHGDIGPEEF